MLTVVLLGELGKRFGRRHQLDVHSPAEAVRALCANFQDFRQFVSTSEQRNVAYRVLNRKDDVGLDELHNPASRTITFVPVVGGASFWQKFGKILVGAALIGASFIPGLNVAVWAGAATTWASVTFSIGVSLALGGVAQLLAPTPKTPAKEADNQASYVFNGAVNTSAQGEAIPVGYGRMVVGSAVISAGISVEDVAA